MEVIVLAGGMGTRLSGVVKDVPKPMAPVNDKPFLDYLLKWIAQFEITAIVLSTGYKSAIIESYFGDNYNGIPLHYAVETTPLGTGGGLINALNYTSDESIIVVNGDTYFPVNLDRYMQYHMDSDSKISLALKEMENFDRYGTVDIKGDIVNRFNEKQYCKSGVINGGIYILNRAFLANKQLPKIFSFEKEIFEKETANNSIKGFIFNEPFIDIGIPDDYYRAGDMLNTRNTI